MRAATLQKNKYKNINKTKPLSPPQGTARNERPAAVWLNSGWQIKK
jgi:hypothetical protein